MIEQFKLMQRQAARELADYKPKFGRPLTWKIKSGLASFKLKLRDYTQPPSADNLMILPREQHLKNEITQLSAQIKEKYGYEIEPYITPVELKKEDENDTFDAYFWEDPCLYINYDLVDEDNSDNDMEMRDIEFETMQEALENIPFLNETVHETIAKGRLKYPDKINRAYVLKMEDRPMAGISFTINHITHTCHIDGLGVNNEHQGKKMGSILLEIAITISGMYGCTDIDLETTEEGIRLYKQHGFIVLNLGNLPEDEYQACVLNKTQQTIEGWLNMSLTLQFSNPHSMNILNEVLTKNLPFMEPIAEKNARYLACYAKINGKVKDLFRLYQCLLNRPNIVMIDRLRKRMEYLSEAFTFPKEMYDMVDTLERSAQGSVKRLKF